MSLLTSIYFYKSLIAVYLFLHLVFTFVYAYEILWKIGYNKIPTIISAPKLYQETGWYALLINILIIRPRLNIFKLIYLTIFKFYNKMPHSFKPLLLYLFWLIFQYLTDLSRYAFFIIFYSLKHIFNFSQSHDILYHEIKNLFFKDYEYIKDLRIIYDFSLWLNPIFQLNSIKSLILSNPSIKNVLINKKFNCLLQLREELLNSKTTEQYTFISKTPSNRIMNHTAYNINGELTLSQTHAPLQNSYQYTPDIMQRTQYLVPINNSSIPEINMYNFSKVSLRNYIYPHLNNALVHYSRATSYEQYINFINQAPQVSIVKNKILFSLNKDILNLIENHINEIIDETGCSNDEITTLTNEVYGYRSLKALKIQEAINLILADIFNS